jgi:hypothetical protein
MTIMSAAPLHLLALLKLMHRLLLRLLALDEAEDLLQLGVVDGNLAEAGALGAPLDQHEDARLGLVRRRRRLLRIPQS